MLKPAIILLESSADYWKLEKVQAANVLYLGLDYQAWQSCVQAFPALQFVNKKEDFDCLASQLEPELKSAFFEMSSQNEGLRKFAVQMAQADLFASKLAGLTVLYFLFKNILEQSEHTIQMIVVEDRQLFEFIGSKHRDQLNIQEQLVQERSAPIAERFDSEALAKRWRRPLKPQCLLKNVTLLFSWVNAQTVNKDCPFQFYWGSLAKVDEHNSSENIYHFVYILNDLHYEEIRAQLETRYENVLFAEDYLSIEDFRQVHQASLQKTSRSLKAMVMDCDVSALWRNSVEALGGDDHERFALIWQRLAYNLFECAIDVKKFLYLMENQSWEKVMIHALREKYPEIEIVAYQHAQVPEHLGGYRPTEKALAVMPLPDKLICNGSNTYRLMEPIWKSHVQILNGPALRLEDMYRQLGDSSKIARRNSGTCIGMAGAVFLEVTWQMFEDCLAVLEEQSSWSLRIRLHPADRLERYHVKLQQKPRLAERVHFSQNSLSAYFAEVDGLVCPGSSMLLQAALLGLPHFLYVGWNRFPCGTLGLNSEHVYDAQDIQSQFSSVFSGKQPQQKALKLEDFYNPVDKNSLNIF